MAKQTLHLVGGGPGAFLSTRRHFKTALGELAAPRPLVAYVGTAHKDNRGFFAMIRTGLGASHARIELAKIAHPRAKVSEATALLDDCDMVFVSGGDVELGMRLLDDRGVSPKLRALAKAAKPMFGISAGSLMLAREWVRFPDDDEDRAEVFPCLGIAPLHADAHSEDDGWSELRVLIRLLHRRGDERPVGYGLTRQGCLRIEVGASVKMTALGSPIPRVVVRRGSVVEGTPLARAD